MKPVKRNSSVPVYVLAESRESFERFQKANAGLDVRYLSRPARCRILHKPKVVMLQSFLMLDTSEATEMVEAIALVGGTIYQPKELVPDEVLPCR